MKKKKMKAKKATKKAPKKAAKKAPRKAIAVQKAGHMSLTIESGCAVVRLEGHNARLRMFDSAGAAIASGLTKDDHVLYGGGRSGGSVRADFVPPPEGACSNIDCYLDSTGSTANDTEMFVKGSCTAPCTCELWVHDAFDKPWYSKGAKGKVKLKDYAGYAAVCAK
jgi:hypothetical protein